MPGVVVFSTLGVQTEAGSVLRAVAKPVDDRRALATARPRKPVLWPSDARWTDQRGELAGLGDDGGDSHLLLLRYQIVEFGVVE